MSIEEVVRERIKMARLGSDEKNFLRAILGELSSKKNMGETTVLKELLRSNERRGFQRNPQEAARIGLERCILRSLLGETENEKAVEVN